MTSREVQKLGKKLAELEDQLQSFLRAGIGLGNSSFDNGQLQQFTDGVLGSSFGTQFDGTNGIVALNGPPPPTPRFTSQWGPTAEGIIGGVRVRWEGFFEPDDFVAAPQDFASVEVYVSENPTPNLLFADMRTTINTARGGEVLLPMPVSDSGYYVWLVARSTTGRASGFSRVVGPLFPMKIRQEDLGFEIGDLAGSQIFWGGTAPTGAALGDLWLKLPQEEAYRFTPDAGWALTANQAPTVAALKEAIGSAITTDGSQGLSTGDATLLVASARALADAAQTKATQASADAQAASGLATLAKTAADSKVTVYRQTSIPTGGTYALNDLWIDTDDTNKLYAWGGGAWVLVDDQRIATALATATGKTTIFAQISQPATTGRTTGDQWIDTDDGNKVYIWNGAWTATLFGAPAISATARQLGAISTYRQATAPASGMVVNDLWIDSDDNKLYSYQGTTLGWVLSQDAGIQQALTNAGNANTLAAGKTTTFYQISQPPTTGRTIGDLWVDTDDGNKIYTWNGTWAVTLFAAQALNVTARQLGAFAIYRQTSAPTTGVLDGDYWIDSSAGGGNKAYLRVTGVWTAVQDAAIQTALTNASTAQGTANSKIIVFAQISAPPTTGRTVGDVWIDTDDSNVTYTWDGTIWAKRQIASGAIAPNSLVAKDVIATGTVTAALLEAILVLATTIVAGNPNATHVKIKSDGVYVYSVDANPANPPSEVIRMGTASNDYFGITNGSGLLVLSLDMTGAVNARTANFREDITVQGRSLTAILKDIPGGGTSSSGAANQTGWNAGAFINGVTTEIGLIERAFNVEAGRIYMLIPTFFWTRSANSTYLEVHVRDGGTGTPTIGSPMLTGWFESGGDNPGWTLPFDRMRTVRFATTGVHRLLLTVLAGGGGTVNITDTFSQAPQLTLIDLGPDRGNPASTNRGGGSTAAPVQQYDTGWMTPDGWRSYQGGGGVRSDTTDVVQGWDPSGFNGDGSGFWWWNSKIPSITGTVDKVWVWLASNSTYYNSGGTGIIAPIKTGTGFPVSGGQVAAPIQYGTFPKPGNLQMDISGWASLFHNNAGANRAMGVSVGPGGGTNEQFYIRFDGPAARMRILYTQ